MVYGHTPFQKLVRQYAKLMAIINPDYEIKFPDIQDKKLMDVMKVCSSVVLKIWKKTIANENCYQLQWLSILFHNHLLAITRQFQQT